MEDSLTNLLFDLLSGLPYFVGGFALGVMYMKEQRKAREEEVMGNRCCTCLTGYLDGNGYCEVCDADVPALLSRIEELETRLDSVQDCSTCERYGALIDRAIDAPMYDGTSTALRRAVEDMRNAREGRI